MYVVMLTHFLHDIDLHLWLNNSKSSSGRTFAYSITVVNDIRSYIVVGCADLIAPDNASHKRKGNVATIGCQKQNKTWHLVCDGERWQGVVGSCDQSGM